MDPIHIWVMYYSQSRLSLIIMAFKEPFVHSFIPIEWLQKHLLIRAIWAESYVKQLNMKPDMKRG